ncbi:Uncharacterised protein [Salmonella enterica subsp. salamae]|nr:Uncharacterised protein [Salmonella enterica subsp. salamae]
MIMSEIHTLKRDMPAAFLKVADSKQIILKHLLMRIIANKIHKSDRDIMPVVRNGFTIQQVEHSFQIGELVASPAPVQAVAPSVMLHQIVDDNLLAETARVVGFVVPA